jgi:hypothetical protein
VQREWARIGAHTRLVQIEQERIAILKAFPELRRNGSVPAGDAVLVVPPKRQFSAAARRRMSAGMRKFWARRKAEARAKASARTN